MPRFALDIGCRCVNLSYFIYMSCFSHLVLPFRCYRAGLSKLTHLSTHLKQLIELCILETSMQVYWGRFELNCSTQDTSPPGPSLEAIEDTYMFPRRQNKCMNLIFKFRKSLPPALNAVCFLPEHQCLNLCVELHSSPSVAVIVKRWMLKSYSHCWEGIKYAKEEDCVGPGGFPWRTACSLTAQYKQNNHNRK